MVKTVDIQKTFPLVAIVICYCDIIIFNYPFIHINFISKTSIIYVILIVSVIIGTLIRKYHWSILILIIHLFCFSYSYYKENQLNKKNQLKHAKNIAPQLPKLQKIASSNSYCVGKKLNKCQLLGGVVPLFILNNKSSFIIRYSYNVKIKPLVHNKHQIELGTYDHKIKIKFQEPTKLSKKQSLSITRKYLVLFPCQIKPNLKSSFKNKTRVCLLKNQNQIIVLDRINFKLTLNDYIEMIQTKLSLLFNDFPTTQILIGSLILGQKKFLSPSVIKNTANLGILHLFVISGAHLVLLWSIITNLTNFVTIMFLYFYPKYSIVKHLNLIKYFIPYLCCGLYVIISGSQIPAIRAFLWISAIMICYGKGTKLSVFYTFSSLIITFHTLFPLNVFHPSWHLSMVASLFILIPSLVMKSNLINQKPQKYWDPFFIFSGLKKNMVVVLGLIPLCIYYFQQTSLWGIIYSIVFGYSLAWFILPSLLMVIMVGIVSNTTFEIIMPLMEKLYHLWFNCIDFFPTSKALIIRIGHQHSPFYPLIFYTLVFLFFMTTSNIHRPLNNVKH